MMYEKARLFGDTDIMDKILALIPKNYVPVSSDSKEWRKYMKEVKQLGREVRNFDETVWADNREEIMHDGLYLKFSQNEEYKNLLISTSDSILVEAAPRDRIWGVGVGKEKAMDPKKWRGLNLLGKALMSVRKELTSVN